MKTQAHSEPLAVGFVLAGGHSSRMGRDKAVAMFRSRPLIALAVETLQAAGLSVVIAGARSDLSSYAPVLAEVLPGAGPLSGVHAALSTLVPGVHSPLAVVLPVDMPLLPSALLRLLIARASLTGAVATFCRVNGHPEPFPAVLDVAMLPSLTMQLTEGKPGNVAAWRVAARQLGRELDCLPMETLVASGAVEADRPPSDWFHSVNAPADLAWLEAMSRVRGPRRPDADANTSHAQIA